MREVPGSSPGKTLFFCLFDVLGGIVVGGGVVCEVLGGLAGGLVDVRGWLDELQRFWCELSGLEILTVTSGWFR